jgi:hypothetical protein
MVSRSLFIEVIRHTAKESATRTGQLCVVFDWRAEPHHSQRFPDT